MTGILPELLILRHGETEWNATRRMQGDLDSPLTAKGREQAALQGAILRAIGAQDHAVISSPQGRALHTAGIALGRPRGEIATDPRLREIGIGDWAGVRLEDIRLQRPDLFGAPLGWYGQAPGGESLEAVGARVGSLLETLDAPTIIVTHGITSRVLRCCATGRSAADFADVEGGQGVVFRVRDGQIERLTAPPGAGNAASST